MIGRLIERTSYKLRELEFLMTDIKPGERTIKTTEFVEEECKKLIDLVVANSK